MKKYKSRATKMMALLTIINVIVLIAGTILIVTNSVDVGVGLTMSGGLMSILFLTCSFAAKSRYLTIDDEKIILPRGADNNGKTVFKRTVVKIDEITSVGSNLYKGDGLISKDTYFHTIKLKDGTKITFTLYDYGKEAEKEIIETIKNSI